MINNLRNENKGNAIGWHVLVTCMVLCMMMLTAVFVKPAQAEAVQKKTYANVVIFAYFKDGNTDEYYENNTNSNLSYNYYRSLKDNVFYQDEKVKNAFLKMYDGDESYSVTNYMNQVSDGQFKIVNEFPQLKDGVITPYCINNTKLADAKTGNLDAEVISEIMKNVSLPSGMTVDYDGDGCVDNLTVVLRGGGVGVGSTGGKGAPTLYAHKADLGAEAWPGTGKDVNAYNMLNTYSIMESIGGSESGVLIHEFMHTIGFPDLYPQEGAEDNYPVYTWDVMATSARYQSYPLAYMRMKIAGWINENDIPVITSSQTKLTLDKQDKADGKRAYIIKSPLNNEQFFVVEFRKKAASAGVDRYIGGDGIIVYRIDPSVDELSNHGGKTAVYVFRPQSGNGYNADNPLATVQNAYLSADVDRTEMGSADMSKKLKDGAIAFSNGENSGIVISNVSSAKGDQMTFDVSVPSASDYDIWNDTKFVDSATSDTNNYKTVAIKNWNGIPHMAVYRGSKISLWKYADSAWKQVGSEIGCDYLSSLNLEVYNGELYLSYDLNGKTINVKKMSRGASTWTNAGQTSGFEHSLQAMSDGLYMAYLKPATGFNSNAILAKVAGGTITDLETYKTGFIGDPNIAQAGGKIYVSVRDASSSANDLINVFKYENGSMQEVSQSDLQANTYDMVGNGDKIYVTLGGSEQELKLYSYDGSKWKTIGSGKSCFQPKLSVSQGNVYILMTPDTDGSIKVIRYDEENKDFVEEGINIDGAPSTIDFTAIDHKLFVGYVRQSDSKIYVKLKESTAPDTGDGSGETGHVHTIVTDPAASATTSANGKTEGSHCSECGAVIVAQEEIVRVTFAGLSKVSPYTGKVKTPSVTVKDADGNILNAGTDYTAEYFGKRTTVGTYKVGITLSGKYRGSIARYFKINPKGTKLSKATAGKKKLTVTWKKQRTQTTGYQVRYALKSNFSGAKTTTIKKNTTTKKVIKKLRSKKYYYVKVRTYKKTGGKYYYSSWSSAKKVKVK